MATVISTEGKSTEGKPRRRRKRGSDRWLSEVKGIAALLAAGFALIALATFDPTLTPSEQQGLTGPVGVWLGWATFQSFGYAGFLLPLLLGGWGASAFLRPIVVRGWVPLAGLGALLIAAAGMLTQATRVRSGAIGGGLVGYATTGVLQAGFGDVGTWLMLVAAIPIGVLCVTRVSYAAVVRITTSRLTRLKRRKAQSTPAVRVAAEPASAVEPQASELFALPVVVEPSRPRGRLAEQGLAWQETFDFGRGGAATFQLPPVGLLKVPPASELKRTREELQDNAETIRRKLQDFEVEGRIVQVSPGPIITSYEFEPAAGVKISQVRRLISSVIEASLSNNTSTLGDVNQQLQALQTFADVLAQVRTAQQASLASVQELRTMQQGALAQSQQELTQAQHTQQELWQQRQSAQAETQQWQERHTATVQSLAETRAQLQQAAAAGEALQQHLRSQIAQSTQESTAWRLLYEQAQHQQTTLQAQLTERDETVRQFEAAQAAVQGQEFGQLRQAMGQAQEALHAVQQQVQAGQTETQQWQAHHAEATQALAALQEQRTAMAADVARGQTLAEQATQRATAAEQHNVHLQTQLQTALLEHQQTQVRSTEEREFLHKQLDMRQADLERLRHSADNAQQTLAETRTALENVQEQVQQARHAETAQALTAVRTQLEAQGAQAAQELERVQTQYTQAMQERDALQVQLSHLTDAVQQHEQTLVSQREALQRATAAADGAQQQLHAQADQEAKRTTDIQALQQRVSQGLATAIAQKVVTLQPAPDHLTLRISSETLFRSGTVALRPESRDILEQIVAVLHTVPDYLCRVDGHTDDGPMTGAARERFPSHWELSAVRAVALVRFFQERNIPAERLVASGHAFHRPLAPNTTPEGRAQNRRIEISLIPPPVLEDRPAQR